MIIENPNIKIDLFWAFWTFCHVRTKSNCQAFRNLLETVGKEFCPSFLDGSQFQSWHLRSVTRVGM